MAGRKKTDDTLETAPQGRAKKRATAADKLLNTLETELAIAKVSQSRPVEVFTCFEADAIKAKIELQNSQARLVKVKQKELVAWEDLNKVRRQFAGLLTLQRERYLN